MVEVDLDQLIVPGVFEGAGVQACPSRKLRDREFIDSFGLVGVERQLRRDRDDTGVFAFWLLWLLCSFGSERGNWRCTRSLSHAQGARSASEEWMMM